MSFALADLAVPLVGAPMAGGPGTPELAAAVSNAGGLGFVAAGYLSAQRLADDLRAARAAGTGPVGVNLFVPQPSVAQPAELQRYRDALVPEAVRYGVELGPARWDDDGWAEKLEAVADLRPEAVSFTFALPDRLVLQRLRELGIYTLMTVTKAAEAEAAVAQGIDALVVQGPEAGGHRGAGIPSSGPRRSRSANWWRRCAASSRCRWSRPAVWVRWRRSPRCSTGAPTRRSWAPRCCSATRRAPMLCTAPR